MLVLNGATATAPRLRQEQLKLTEAATNDAGAVHLQPHKVFCGKGIIKIHPGQSEACKRQSGETEDDDLHPSADFLQICTRVLSVSFHTGSMLLVTEFIESLCNGPSLPRAGGSSCQSQSASRPNGAKVTMPSSSLYDMH
jgi:hypothetical protein